jgi:hypothetical protein
MSAASGLRSGAIDSILNRSGGDVAGGSMMETVEGIWIHGGLALAAGIIILIFPKILYWLVGAFLLLNGAVAFFYGQAPLAGAALGLAGLLILIFPKLVGRLIAIYLLLFALILLVSGVFWLAALPVAVVGVIILIFPNSIAYLVGGLLALGGALGLLARFFG